MGSLNEKQYAVILGCLLGDGTLRKKTNTLLEINHSYKQETYVLWLYDVLANLVGTFPKFRSSGHNRFSFRFTTLSLQELNHFYDLFYGNKGVKKIPETLKLNGLSLAVWFMDDGSKSRNSVYLNTQQFNTADHRILLEALKQLGISANLNKDKRYHRIRVSVGSMTRFRELVRPFMVESMNYKLP